MNNILKFHRNLVLPLVGWALLIGCNKDRNIETPASFCQSNLEANITFDEVKAYFVDATIQIRDDWVISGYIISSDKAGNFFNTLHFQDDPMNPEEGFQIEIELADSHLFYEVGTRIFINLKGLYLGKSKEVFRLGGVFTSFGNVSVGRLPATVVSEHIIRSCDPPVSVEPRITSIVDLDESMVNTLVGLKEIEVINSELEQSYALAGEETKRTLSDCEGNEIVLLNSGFSDFQGTMLPAGNGSITGVLYRERSEYQLIIRDLTDVSLLEERCMEGTVAATSERIFISELADPDNNNGARFIELYNSGEEAMPLEGWSLRRYTNGNTEIGSAIDLSGQIIAAGSAMVISPDPTEFETVFGFAPDLGVGINSPADSNGDDTLQLTDPFGNTIDIFGKIGEDGSGTNHEFEDGRALRNSDITKGNPVYTIEEWTIYNDTGGAGTQNLPQNAPEDFTPGSR
ncbi:MAG TPA: DUF5689 domain-containing protein [Eudoraea sp.]|nr:DUF5689 domain-containing protein [Eudoraea sp.]